MRLRFVTYNIQDGGHGREARLLEALRLLRPDVAVLQEVYEPATVQTWADALGMAHAFAHGNARRHLALLSRHPIVGFNSYHPRPPITTSLLEAHLALSPHLNLRVYGVHLLAQPFVAMEAWRLWEVAVILKRIRANPHGLLVVAGDFNAVAPGDAVATRGWPRYLKLMLAAQGGHIFRTAIGRMLRAGLTDCYRALNPTEPGHTLPSFGPNTRLDYAFASPALRPHLKAVTVVREPAVMTTASDHSPLVVEFEF